MSLEIKALTLTLALGAFGVYGLIQVVRACGLNWRPQFLESSRMSGGGLYAAVALAICFGVGVLIEGVAKSYTSRRLPVLYEVFSQIMDSDREIRTKNLMKFVVRHHVPGDVGKFVYEVEAGPSFNQIMRAVEARIEERPTIALFVDESMPVLRRVAEADRGRPLRLSSDSYEELCNAVNQLYYLSKNLAYQNDNYFAELVRIEDSVSYTRAITVLMVVLGTLSLAALGVAACLSRRDPKPRYPELIGALFFYIAATYFSSVAYRSESTNYNLRVFGYASVLITAAD